MFYLFATFLSPPPQCIGFLKIVECQHAPSYTFTKLQFCLHNRTHCAQQARSHREAGGNTPKQSGLLPPSLKENLQMLQGWKSQFCLILLPPPKFGFAPPPTPQHFPRATALVPNFSLCFPENYVYGTWSN